MHPRARAATACVAAAVLWAGCAGSPGPDTGGPTAAPAPGPGPSIAGCAVFPADNPWNRDISAEPVDPDSARYIRSMNGGSRFLHPDFGSDPGYGIPWTTARTWPSSRRPGDAFEVVRLGPVFR